MSEKMRSEEIGAFDRLLMALGIFPWEGLYLAVVGFITIPVMSLLVKDPSGWKLIPSLLAVLLMLRLVPAALRRLLPFSSSLLRVWAERRQISKHYDSYQWRKLFWLGIGLASYTTVSGQFSVPRIVVTSTCLLSGALGLARWRVVAPRVDTTATPNGPGRNSASLTAG